MKVLRDKDSSQNRNFLFKCARRPTVGDEVLSRADSFNATSVPSLNNGNVNSACRRKPTIGVGMQAELTFPKLLNENQRE